MRKVLMSVLCLLSFGAAWSQGGRGVIRGTVADAEHKPLDKASVSLLDMKDSTVVSAVFTSEKGAFELQGLRDTTYRLLVSYLGYRQLTRVVSVSADKGPLELGTLTLSEKSVDLQGITVSEMAPPVTLKGDTMEFNAGSFQTRPNAVVEDLLKKIPGMEVDKDGTIKAQGETVNKVLVDGKPFFGDDPKLATKNLPADIIDKVQVFDKGSDQSEFTGIADPDAQKTINLTIKKDKKQGLFGRASIGGGSDSRFASSLSANRFDNDQQLSLLGSGNNTNNMGFTFNDIRSFMGGGGGRRGGRGGGGGGGGFLGGPGGNGVTTAWMAGLNFRDHWGEKLEVSGSYFFNHTDNSVIRQQHRQNIFQDSSSYNNQDDRSRNSSANHRLNLRMEYQIDSMNSMIFTPSLSYTTNDYRQSSVFSVLDDNKLPLNEGTSSYGSSATSPNLNGNLLYRHRFAKRGRTFSVNFSGGYNTHDAEGTNASSTRYYDAGGGSTLDTLDQHYLQDNTGKNWGVSLTYTEPIMQDRVLEIHASHNNSLNLSDKRTYNMDPTSGKFEDLDSVYSNAFRNTYATNRAGFNIQTTKVQYNYTLGLNVQQNNLESYSITGDSSFGQQTLNFYPQARFDYTFSRNRRLRFEYNGRTQQPSLSQLQPVPDNSDPLRTRVGNPDLKNSFSNNINLNYRSFDVNTYRMFFASLRFNTTMNDIVSANTYNDKGQDSIRYVNANGSYSGNAFVTASFPIAHSRNMINTHSSATLRRDVSLVNGEKNYTRNITLGERVGVNYAFKELFDVSLSANINYNHARNSLQAQLNNDYVNYGGSFDFNINLPAHFTIQTDFDYTANSGLTQGYNQKVAMWNASISKYLFSKQQGQLKLQAFDLLNQHLSIQRNVADNYIQDVQSNVIPQYFMLSFTYFLNRFPGSGNRGGRGDRGPGGGMGGPPRGFFMR